MHGFGGVHREFPAGQIDTLHLLGAKAVDAELVGEVRRAANSARYWWMMRSQFSGRCMNAAGAMSTDVPPR